MVETVMSVLDSLGVEYAAKDGIRAPLNFEDLPHHRDRPPSRAHLCLNDVEVEQREHLDDIAIWRRTLMSSVLQEQE